jgi:hypothetical protein
MALRVQKKDRLSYYYICGCLKVIYKKYCGFFSELHSPPSSLGVSSRHMNDTVLKPTGSVDTV